MALNNLQRLICHKTQSNKQKNKLQNRIAIVGGLEAAKIFSRVSTQPWLTLTLVYTWFKIKRSFFKAAVVSILLYGCTTWTLTKRLEKKLDGNYTRMLWAILNKSWRQHPTSHQLYGHLLPMTKTIKVRRTRHAGRADKGCTTMDPHIWPSKSRTTS